ncbi:hypothetical protein Bpro_1702 [Polaromonas sp. JS666]|nr:hypothetical protein Bpro_1702 [Polaromonas sp. JS666]
MARIPVLPEQAIQYALISQPDADCASSPIDLIKRLVPHLFLLDFTARSIHHQSDPSNAGAGHLGADAGYDFYPGASAAIVLT